MFCTNCGVQAHDGDMFCPGCGTRLKHASQANQQAGQQQYSNSSDRPAQGYTYDPNPAPRPAGYPGNPFAQEEPKKNKSGAKGRRSMGVIVAMLILVVLAMMLFVGARGYMGDDLSNMMSSCSGCSETAVPPAADDDTDGDDESIFGNISAADITSAADVATTTTTTATTTTTTTTVPTTTTTTVDALKQEAEEIREMLVSRKWQTELEGYKATVTFNKNGTAAITVKVLFISKTINAKYSVNDKCHAVIQADYEGQTLGISGQISKVSSTKLLVERDKNMGEVTLTAA